MSDNIWKDIAQEQARTAWRWGFFWGLLIGCVATVWVVAVTQ